jgi:YD repeat-containing protein
MRRLNSLPKYPHRHTSPALASIGLDFVQFFAKQANAMLNFHKKFCCGPICIPSGILAVSLFLLSVSSALAVDWQFEPLHCGRVLDEGGWYQQYNLGTVNASPEFNFPLQLVYITTRANSGLFGAQWFCPQLESSVVPEANGVFIWQMPSGTIDVFRVEPNSTSDYFDVSRQWFAKFDSDRQLIQNQEGWLYEYRHGHLVAVTSPTNRVLQFTWTGDDQLQSIQIQDPVTGQGPTLLQAGYTDEKRINSLVFGGTQHQFAYFPGRDGRLSNWVAPNKQSLLFTYADVGILEYIQDQNAAGTTQTFSTELDNPKLSLSDQKNPAHWRLVQDPDQKYTYTKDWKLIVTSGTGLATTNDINLKRGIIKETVAGGGVRTTYYYRAPGQKYDGKLRRIEENGKVMVECYYDRKTGLLIFMIDEHGTRTNFDYPADWQPTRENPWDPKPIRVWQGTPDNPQVLASYAYDASGHVTAVQDKAGQITRYNYDSRNQLESVTNPQGITTNIGYDSLGRLSQTKTGAKSQTVGYDEMGRIKSLSSSDGTSTAYDYDALGNISKIYGNGKVVTEYVRDAAGKVTGIKDALGRLKKVETDKSGNITADYAPDGSCTKYEYDAFNRRTSQTDGNGNKTTFAYDAADHPVLQTNPLGETTQWKYDKLGRLESKITAAQTIKYSYDKNNHLSVIDYGSGQTINCEYDDQGQIVSAVTPQTSMASVYDSSGFLSAIRYIGGQDEQLVRFRYDPSGRRTGLILAHLRSAVAPLGDQVGKEARYDILQQTEYGYDGAGQLSAITSCGQPIVTYQYDAENRISKKIFGNGMTADLSYDGLGHLAQIVFSKGPISSPLTLTYVWDAADQVTRRTWNGATQRYEYTPAGQLAKVINDQSGDILEAYSYDKAGNMVEKMLNGQKTTMTYNAANELTSTSGPNGNFQYAYDKAGRMTGSGNGTITAYGWLDKAVQLTNPSGQSVSLTYWPNGQLAHKSISDSNGETFLWDGLAVLRRGDTIYVTEPHANGGAVIASHSINQPANLTYYLNDLLGTSLASVNNNNLKITGLTSFGELARNESPQPVNPSPTTVIAPTNPLPKIQQISPTSN